MILLNVTTGSVVAENVRLARDPFTRLIGLLGRATVAPSEGLWLARCGAVHTLGMRAKIDLIFLDVADRVIDVMPNARRNRPAFTRRGTNSIVELGAGSRLDLVLPGHLLRLS
jgi:uncharacterized membrane protein (UPF0127 family)